MRLLALLVLAIAVAGCTRPAAETQLAGADETGGAPSSASLDPRFASVTIRDGLYDPGRTTLAPGTTLEWRNAGSATHSVVSDDGGFSGSGPIDGGQSFRFTFQQAGEYHYHCRYHPGMTGTIVVR